MGDSKKSLSEGQRVLLLLFLQVMNVAIVVMTILEVSLVFHLNFVTSFVHLGMNAGSTLWILGAVSIWWLMFFHKPKLTEVPPLRDEIVMGLTTTAFAICTQVSIHWGLFIPISNWANATLSLFCLGAWTMVVIPESLESFKRPAGKVL